MIQANRRIYILHTHTHTHIYILHTKKKDSYVYVYTHTHTCPFYLFLIEDRYGFLLSRYEMEITHASGVSLQIHCSCYHQAQCVFGWGHRPCFRYPDAAGSKSALFSRARESGRIGHWKIKVSLSKSCEMLFSICDWLSYLYFYLSILIWFRHSKCVCVYIYIYIYI